MNNFRIFGYLICIFADCYGKIHSNIRLSAYW